MILSSPLFLSQKVRHLRSTFLPPTRNLRLGAFLLYDLRYEEPEDEGEGDPEEDLLQELLLLELRRSRTGVVARPPRDGAAAAAAAVRADVHVGREEAEGERADSEGHLRVQIWLDKLRVSMKPF